MEARFAVAFVGGQKIDVLLRKENTRTTSQLMSSLPFESVAHRWGDEIYFEAPFHTGLENDARQDMEAGEVAFWPDGDAIAIFFGRTPASKGSKPRAYSACNIVGNVDRDLSVLRAIREGTKLAVRRI